VKPKLVYIAHRLGSGPDREHHRAEAAKWVAWAARREGVVPVATWITLAGEWPETDEMRQHGLALDLLLIDRCDEIWLCGATISAGMRVELEHAKQRGIIVQRFEVRS
jgi:hypothetical protein